MLLRKLRDMRKHFIRNKLTQSSGFCPLPWVHLSTHTTGRPRICCDAEGHVENSEGREVDLSSSKSLIEYMNSKTHREIRKKMLAGKRPTECKKCYKYERNGGHSPRQDWIDAWRPQMDQILENTREDGSIVKTMIDYIDLPLGNKCNLSCRMCGPESSNQLETEFEELGFSFDSDGVDRLRKEDWTQSENLTALLDQALPTTQMLYFTGGEPFLIERHYQVLEKAIELGSAQNTRIRYNTNLTVVPRKLLKLWDHFAEISLNCSIEGSGPLNDYIRYPSRWSIISKNLKLLDDYASSRTNVTISIHSTFQALNVGGIPAFLEQIKQLELKNCFLVPYYIVLSHPSHLKADILPGDLKHEYKEQILNYIEKNREFYLNVENEEHRSWNESKLRRLRSLVLGMLNIDGEQQKNFNKFREIISAQDRFRNQDVCDVIPELGPYFSKQSEGERIADKYSKTFCVYPWMHVMTNPEGHSFLCCRSKSPTGSLVEPSENGKVLSDTFNSSKMKTIRQKMLAGEQVSDCQRCYADEKNNCRSLRQDSNRKWLDEEFRSAVDERVKASQSNDFAVHQPPMLLDWRPGNKCNLKCRMCGPENSSAISKEWNSMITESDEVSSFITKYRPLPSKENPTWYKNPEIWQELENWLPELKEIYLTGGEPTLIEENWQLFARAQELKLSQNMELRISLNLTYLPNRFQQVLESFKKVTLNLSIDGMGPVQEYIRHPSKWAHTETNIDKLLQWDQTNVDIWFTPVVQVYNILHLPKFIEWILQKKRDLNSSCNIYLLVAEGQPYNQIEILPDAIRQLAIPLWKNLWQHPAFYTCGPILKERVDLVIKILETQRADNSTELLEDFSKFTKIFDEKRDQSFSDTFPEMNKILNSHPSTIQSPRA